MERIGDNLDDPSRADELASLLQGKAALRKYYLEIYGKYRACLNRCPRDGQVLELGSGAGFLKTIIPEAITSDVIPYPLVDRVVDATAMSFETGSLRAIFMLNVLHHIPDVEAFFAEAVRCLVPGGRVLIVDQYPGVFSSIIYRCLHHEPFDPRAVEWKFASSGPLSDANGALAWIVFERDRKLFEQKFPLLRITSYVPHSPFRYWLAGGLKKWSLLPGWAFGLATIVDSVLSRVCSKFGSFVDIEIVRSHADWNRK